MPNCAPRICIDEKNTDDKDTWPEKSKRAWRAEADYSVLGAENHVNEIKEKADGQKVKTFVKSNGYEINIIDTELVHSLRWNKLPRNKRYYLEMQYKSETICEYRDNIGNIERVKNEETNELLLSVIEKTQKDGYFTFGEMLLYAKKF